MSTPYPFNLFESKPKSGLAEVTYHLYLPKAKSGQTDFDLQQVRDDCISYLKEYTEPYIYQNEHFDRYQSNINKVIHDI